jgi:hypothetical protein
MFSNLSCVQQKKVVIEWMRANLVKGNQKYRIPYLLDPSSDTEDYNEFRTTPVCASAMMDLLHRG